ncbi:MAG: hypothetical protein ACXWHZ_05055 [Usitatibacter sp.]
MAARNNGFERFRPDGIGFLPLIGFLGAAAMGSLAGIYITMQCDVNISFIDERINYTFMIN